MRTRAAPQRDRCILLRHLAEVLLAKAFLRFCVQCHRLRQGNRNSRLATLQDLLTTEVATVSDNIEHDWASHAADAFRYLAMAWSEPMAAEDEKPDSVKELLKPRTWSDIWQSHIDEQYEAGADDLPDYAHEFNLNNAPKMD